jgi:hypothetical protein
LIFLPLILAAFNVNFFRVQPSLGSVFFHPMPGGADPQKIRHLAKLASIAYIRIKTFSNAGGHPMIKKISLGKTGHQSSRTIFGPVSLGRVSQSEADRMLDPLWNF